MSIWVILAVAAGVVWFLARPLLSGQATAASRERAERGRLRDLLAAKEATYSALKEIEFDHLTRKLDESDYQTLRTQYRAQAVRLLQEIDTLRIEAAPTSKKRGAQRRKQAPVR
jgi:hypothetical protein